LDKEESNTALSTQESAGELSQFTESYASFNRVVNSLQRQYLELKEEYANQNRSLSDVNQKLSSMSAENLAANEFLNGILNSVAAGVIAVDSDGTITNFNPAASVLFGIPRGEPVGQPYRTAIPPGNPIEANALRTAETGKEISAVERKITLVDGTVLYLSVSTALLRDGSGKSL